MSLNPVLWGLHPLYHADVRLFCAHLSVPATASFRQPFAATAQGGSSTSAPRDTAGGLVSNLHWGRDSHFLYGRHPIASAEVAGTVVAVDRREMQTTVVVDDGTGTAQGVLFNRNLDGGPTDHPKVRIGDKVVVAGAITWGRATVGERAPVRELLINRIRVLRGNNGEKGRRLSPLDELALHWKGTLELHRSVYSKSLQELMPSYAPLPLLPLGNGGGGRGGAGVAAAGGAFPGSTGRVVMTLRRQSADIPPAPRAAAIGGEAPLFVSVARPALPTGHEAKEKEISSRTAFTRLVALVEQLVRRYHPHAINDRVAMESRRMEQAERARQVQVGGGAAGVFVVGGKHDAGANNTTAAAAAVAAAAAATGRGGGEVKEKEEDERSSIIDESEGESSNDEEDEEKADAEAARLLDDHDEEEEEEEGEEEPESKRLRATSAQDGLPLPGGPHIQITAGAQRGSTELPPSSSSSSSSSASVSKTRPPLTLEEALESGMWVVSESFRGDDEIDDEEKEETRPAAASSKDRARPTSGGHEQHAAAAAAPADGKADKRAAVAATGAVAAPPSGVEKPQLPIHFSVADIASLLLLHHREFAVAASGVLAARAGTATTASTASAGRATGGDDATMLLSLCPPVADALAQLCKDGLVYVVPFVAAAGSASSSSSAAQAAAGSPPPPPQTPLQFGLISHEHLIAPALRAYFGGMTLAWQMRLRAYEAAVVKCIGESALPLLPPLGSPAGAGAAGGTSSRSSRPTSPANAPEGLPLPQPPEEPSVRHAELVAHLRSVVPELRGVPSGVVARSIPLLEAEGSLTVLRTGLYGPGIAERGEW